MKSTLALLIVAVVIASASAFGVYTPVNVSQRVSYLLWEKQRDNWGWKRNSVLNVRTLAAVMAIRDVF